VGGAKRETRNVHSNEFFTHCVSLLLEAMTTSLKSGLGASSPDDDLIKKLESNPSPPAATQSPRPGWLLLQPAACAADTRSAVAQHFMILYVDRSTL
jgi:hypothetical protein